MINKKGMWFITLFSIIIVMFTVYFSVPNLENEILNEKNNKENYTIDINNEDILTTLKIEYEQEVLLEMQTLQDVLLDDTKSINEKNNAYNEIKNLNTNKALEESIQKQITSELKLNSFVKIKYDQVEITVAENKHTYKLANEIINIAQKNFNEKKYITVKFRG